MATPITGGRGIWGRRCSAARWWPEEEGRRRLRHRRERPVGTGGGRWRAALKNRQSRLLAGRADSEGSTCSSARATADSARTTPALGVRRRHRCRPRAAALRCLGSDRPSNRRTVLASTVATAWDLDKRTGAVLWSVFGSVMTHRRWCWAMARLSPIDRVHRRSAAPHRPGSSICSGQEIRSLELRRPRIPGSKILHDLTVEVGGSRLD